MKNRVKLWTTVTADMGQAVTEAANRLMIRESELIRLALVQYLQQQGQPQQQQPEGQKC